MEKYFEQLMSFLMPQQCYEDIFYNLNFLNIACLKIIISKGLGYGILAGSLLLRVPQIIKILAASSGEGLSVFSEILQLIAVFGSMSYGHYKKFPISAYGDSYSLYIQGVMILMLIFYYQKNHLYNLIILSITCLLTYLMLSDLIDPRIVLALNGLSLIFSLISKLNQAFINFKNGSTGVLSPITLVLQLGGCVARIFTSIQETGDINLIFQFVVLSIVNGLLVAQWAYYSNKSAKTVKIEKKKKI
jgi:mannose-P-dolichol utilization defect protein 1